MFKSNLTNIKKLEDSLSTGPSSFTIGIRGGAKYPDGTSVEEVATILEYGTIGTPGKAYFRGTMKSNRRKWVEHTKRLLFYRKLSKADTIKNLSKTILDTITEKIGIINTGTLVNNIIIKEVK